MRLTRSFGTLLLAGWLIINGLTHFIHLSFSGMGMIMAGIGTAAGILLILGL